MLSEGRKLIAVNNDLSKPWRLFAKVAYHCLHSKDAETVPVTPLITFLYLSLLCLALCKPDEGIMRPTVEEETRE